MKVMCRVLEVVESGYYAWQHRQPSARQHADEQLSQHIHQIFLEGRGVYRGPRVQVAASTAGYNAVAASRRRA